MSDAAGSPRKKGGFLRWTLRLGVALLLLLVLGILGRNILIRKGAEAVVTQVTAFPFTMGSFNLGLFDARAEIGDMELRNPPGFEDPRCLSIPRLVADIEGKSLFRETLHVEEIVLDIREVVVVRNAAGETNLDRLKALAGDGGKNGEGKPGGKEGGGGKAPPDSGSDEGGTKRKWKCDRLDLTLGRVVYLDYSKMKDGKPKEEMFELRIAHEEFRNIHDPEQIVKIIVLKVLKGTSIKMMNATVESLTGSLKDVTSGIGSAVEGGVKGIGDAIGGIFGGGKKDEPPKKEEPPPKKKKR